MQSGNTAPRQFHLLDPSRRVDIALGVPPEARFGALIGRYGPELTALTRAMRGTIPVFLRPLLPRLAACLDRQGYVPLAPEWRAECNWLAPYAGVSAAELALAQTQYSWVTWLRGLLPGCALSVSWVAERQGFRVLRNLDWAHGALRAAFSRASLRQTWIWPGGRPAAEVIGFPGMLGVLTGARLDSDQRPAFTVILHQAPWPGWPFGRGREPTGLLRMLLEDPAIHTFRQALASLTASRTNAACLVALIGQQREELCVLEFPPGGQPDVCWHLGGRLVLTNHFNATGRFANRNPWPRPDDDYDADLLRNSRGRAGRLTQLATAERLGGDCALAGHQSAPVANAQTVHIVDWPLWLAADADAPKVWCPG